jgi:signal transduction histidine kinase
MKRSLIRKRGPKFLLNLFISGSLVTLLICLCITAIVFSATFIRKEHQRADTFADQLRRFFEFQYRSIAEEMYTHNTDAAVSRITEIAKQLGSSNYVIALADQRGSCVYSGDSKSVSPVCQLPDPLRDRIAKIETADTTQRSVEFDNETKRYQYVTSLYVGPVLKGYLFASISDPYDFYRGHSMMLVGQVFLPAFVAVILLWFIWLAVSRQLILKPYLSNLVELEKNEALGKLASQVAHDIRSPLAALDMVLGDLVHVKEDKRLVIRNAIGRIKDIANNLLEKNREAMADRISDPDRKLQATSEPVSVQLLSSLLDSIVSEKRFQYRPKIGIDIEAKLDACSYGLFGKIQPTEFKRVISNLIDNSIEAMTGKGRVIVSLECSGEQNESVKVLIRDNGRGISPHILPRLMKEIVTFGKAGGSGLGLFHARNTIESWGGHIDLNSEVGKGTDAQIILPRAEAPDWFVSELKILENGPVVVVDDDSSIHQIWQGRLDALKAEVPELSVLHFSTPDELMTWHGNNLELAAKALFLVDYELLGETISGLDLIEGLGIEQNSILVTSRYEETEIRNRCEKVAVRLIPKGMAGFVPIKLEHHLEKVDAILIDDESVIREAWKSIARSTGKRLSVFSTVSDFLRECGSYHPSNPVYIDSNLGNGIKGEEQAKKIHTRGFRTLYLVTAHLPSQFPPMPWIKGILGKSFPDA